MRWLDGITNSMVMNLGRLWGTVRDREAWRAAIHGAVKSWTRLSDGTATAAADGNKRNLAFSPFLVSPK